MRDAVLLESARRGSVEAANRYNRRTIAAMTAVGDGPALTGSRDAPSVA